MLDTEIQSILSCNSDLAVESLDFPYPEELIATQRETKSRVMFLDRQSDPIEQTLSDLETFFEAGDVLVINVTKVLRRRLFTDDGIEILFLRAETDSTDSRVWEVLCPAKKWSLGTEKVLSGIGVKAKLLAKGRTQTIELEKPLSIADFEKFGDLPIPPYIQKVRGQRKNLSSDESQYQTAWAERVGSLAAPTASLHFDLGFLNRLKARGVHVVSIVLHVGLGTFLPVKTAYLSEHQMHAEYCEITADVLKQIKLAKQNKKRVFAMGTTVARSLESWAQGRLNQGTDGTYVGHTDLMITPGFNWQIVDVLLTNFHQPRSTLLALVASFVGLEKIKSAYDWAIKRRFRLFSYGDLTCLVRAQTRNDKP